MTSTVVGVAFVFRHGDRLGYYQDSTSYDASDTNITPLGELQEFQSGLGLYAKYMNSSSPDAIKGVTTPIPNLKQLDVRADASEGQVIVRSAYALMQGLYPATASNNVKLANGSTITSPLGGYTYVPIQTVEPDEDISLEGWTSCPAFIKRNNQVYASAEFQAKAAEAAPFLEALKPLVGNRSVTLKNMWNVFDYMNVENIHNETFAKLVTQEQMEQARDLANYHEYALFTDSTKGGIGNIAGQTILPLILDSLQSFANGTTGEKILALGTAYKPFLSLFNMTEVKNQNIVDYASVAAFEVRETSGAYSVRLNFRNGTSGILDGSDLVPVDMFGQQDVPLSEFISHLSPYTVETLGQWCNACENEISRGCDLIEAVNATDEFGSPASTSGRQHVSPVASGFIGAAIALVLAAVAVLLLEVFRRKRSKSTPPPAFSPSRDNASDHELSKR